MNVNKIISCKENIPLLEELLKEILIKLPEYKQDFYILENGSHFNECTLKESGIEIKYSWEEIVKHIDALGISFPECVTNEDIVYTVNSLYETYFPLISDLSGALRFSEKYIKDKNWSDYDRPYTEWTLIDH